jgi:hypothetical protein
MRFGDKAIPSHSPNLTSGIRNRRRAKMQRLCTETPFAKNVNRGDSDLGLPIVGYSNLSPRGESLPQPMSDGIALFLKTNEESMALLHTATKMAHCRFTTNLSVSVIQRTEEGGLRHTARKLELEAVYASNLGDDKSTTKALLASIGLVRNFSEEPLAIPRLVQQACFGLTKQGLEHALSSLQLDSNQLDSVSSALIATENSLSINNILVSELAWNNDVFSDLRRDNRDTGYQIATDFENMNNVPAWKRNSLAIAYRFLGVLDFDQLNYLRLESTAIHISEQPLPERIHALDTFAQKTNQASVLLPVSQLDVRLSCQFLRLDARFIASLRATRAGLAVESYRSEHGQLPDNPPYDLADPFDGQPIRYKKLAKGYVVYSVGEDTKDDGGDEKKDITFTVER